MACTTAIGAAIRFNNEGARLLESGDIVSAVNVFRRAVEALQNGALASDLGCDNQKQSLETNDLPREPQNSVQNAQLYVYCRPLWIPSSLDFNHGTFSIVSTYILFNMALACHCFGLESGRQEPLDRAVELYQLVLRTSGDTLPSSTSNGIAASSLLQCLALNNLAHLHYEQCEYSFCDQCLGSMESIIWQTNCLDHSAIEAHHLSAYEVEEIMLNMVFVQPPVAAHAA
jgi:hypothetical protein